MIPEVESVRIVRRKKAAPGKLDARVWIGDAEVVGLAVVETEEVGSPLEGATGRTLVRVTMPTGEIRRYLAPTEGVDDSTVAGDVEAVS